MEVNLYQKQLPSDGIIIGFIAPSPPPPYKTVAVAQYQYLEERKGLVPAHNWLELELELWLQHCVG